MLKEAIDTRDPAPTNQEQTFQTKSKQQNNSKRQTAIQISIIRKRQGSH
jgi:hypothetical protein